MKTKKSDQLQLSEDGDLFDDGPYDNAERSSRRQRQKASKASMKAAERLLPPESDAEQEMMKGPQTSRKSTKSPAVNNPAKAAGKGTAKSSSGNRIINVKKGGGSASSKNKKNVLCVLDKKKKACASRNKAGKMKMSRKKPQREEDQEDDLLLDEEMALAPAQQGFSAYDVLDEHGLDDEEHWEIERRHALEKRAAAALYPQVKKWLSTFNEDKVRKLPDFLEVEPREILRRIAAEEETLKLVKQNRREMQKVGLWELSTGDDWWGAFEKKLAIFEKRFTALRMAKSRANQRL
ncbi:unnamed protein product [Amoebophrya sp. A25]|nr:unnamed protein product [Amoebophrya sp. A25]|eukprot:GSA25T00003723001.1